jgi:predicted tellurium resistance membrane protein TerC
MHWVSQPEAWVALVTLTALEIVLGIDNIIFISILVSRLPENQRNKARFIGLSLAMVARIVLLLGISWVMSLTNPLFDVFTESFSGRDLILIGGGLFLLGKSTFEIHNSLEGHGEETKGGKPSASYYSVLTQILILDIVFSLDSVITAVGLVKHLPVMVIAIVIAVLVMMVSAKAIGDFVDSHPTIKMLALSFLILIGVMLVAEGFDVHIPRGYVYFSVAFSAFVEFLNIGVRKKKAQRAA